MANHLMRARRLALGLSQAQLAEAAGISATNMAYYERGQRVPSIYYGMRIANALRCRPEAIFKESK